MAVSPTRSPASDRNLAGDWRLLLRLAPYARRSAKLLLISLLLLVPIASAGAVQPLIIGQAVSLLRGEQTWPFLQQFSLVDSINLLTLLLGLTAIARLSLTPVQGYLVQRTGQEITAGIRDDLFAHVTALAARYFDRTPVGRLVTRLTSDVETLGDVFSTGAIGILSDIVYIVAIAAAILTLNWPLALLLLSILLPVTGLIIFFQKKYREANYRSREELSKLNSMLQENVVGINVVQLFRREGYNSQRFRTINRQFLQAVGDTIFHDSAVSATLEWIALVAVAGVIALGGALFSRNGVDFGTLSAFVLYAQRLFDPLRQFAEKLTLLQSGFTGVERINELMNEPIEIRDPDRDRRKQLVNAATCGEIRFEGVWFAYNRVATQVRQDDDEYILKDLDFIIRPGEKVAFVGPTGAGKSSVIRLLCRLYEPTYGRILLDGIDIRDLPQAELRRYVGVILQESFLFAGDVKANIALGEEYSFEQIQKAAEATNIASFIDRLPQGYDTELRERGANLSGGQKQLLAFARVAIRDPRVLVLDEATASLDVGTEAAIQDALERLMRDRTAIVIAHRLSTIRDVDRILVLKQGELVESGNHEELLQRGGLYASLYQLQMLGQGMSQNG